MIYYDKHDTAYSITLTKVEHRDFELTLETCGEKPPSNL